MARKITLVIDMIIEGGREVREVTLDENLRREVSHLVTRLRKDQGYNIVRGASHWTSIRTDGRGLIKGSVKRFVRKSLLKASL